MPLFGVCSRQTKKSNVIAASTLSLSIWSLNQSVSLKNFSLSLWRVESALWIQTEKTFEIVSYLERFAFVGLPTPENRASEAMQRKSIGLTIMYSYKLTFARVFCLFGLMLFALQCSVLPHLPPLRFHCVRGVLAGIESIARICKRSWSPESKTEVPQWGQESIPGTESGIE
jgi:hypothetical protein